MTDQPNLAKIEKQSVQALPDARKGDGLATFWSFEMTRTELLPQWGTRERERWLRMYYRHPYNWLAQSAFAGLIKKVKNTPWEIKGKRRVKYFQDVLRQADFGRGWGSLVSKVVLDYLRQDGGGFIEVIAPGNPLRPPTGAITGLAALDSYRCLPTGDPEYPVIYYNRKGQLHLLHRTRIIQLLDMPDSDEERPGYGLCALSRAIATVNQQINMNRYINQKLDDRPQPGYVVASNLTEAKVKAAFQTYLESRARDELPPEGNTVWLYSLDPSAPAKLENVTFSQAPDGWSFKEYTELHVNSMALALGVDVQELWQLTGGTLGSGTQSVVLHAKSQGKTFADILTSLERALNETLPEALDFGFKSHDPYESQEEAATANSWAGFSNAVGGKLSDDEHRRLLANKVQAVSDVITDEDGEIIRLNDVDSDEETQTAEDVGNPVAEDAPTGDDLTTLPTQQTPPTDEEEPPTQQKEIQSTRLDFEDSFETLMEQRAVISTRSMAARVRGLIKQYGYLAFQDGLTDGGVKDGVLDEDDQAEYVGMLTAQNAYVSDFAQVAADLSDALASGKPAMWYTKSIAPFYELGRLSADKNGMYEFMGDDGEKGCNTCKRLQGQRHRMKDWTKKKLRPGVDTDNFDCRGFKCRHQLKKTTERARGKF